MPTKIRSTDLMNSLKIHKFTMTNREKKKGILQDVFRIKWLSIGSPKQNS